MAKAGAASLVLVFTPAIAVARAAYPDSAGAYLVVRACPRVRACMRV